MTNYEKLVEALRILQDKNSLSYYKRQVCKDAADAIEKITAMYEKAEMDATNLTGKLAQAEADVERLNREIDKRIATEIELSNQVDALQAEVKILKVSGREAYFEGLAANAEPKRGKWNDHEVACLLAEMFGDDCACNLNGIDEWLPQYCEFAETCCPNHVGVACWEQFLKHRAKMEVQE